MKKCKNLLCLLLVAMLVSCSAPANTETTANSDTDTSVTTAPETEADPYEGIDLGGMELRFLNTEGKLWDTMSILDYEELTGVGVEDAVFNRNRTLEDKLNMTILVNEVSDYQTAMSKSVTAGEDLYDVVYTMSTSLASNITAGMFQNLKDIPTLELDAEWWEPSFNGLLELNNRYLYAVGSPLHLMSMDMTVACYANRAILTDNGLDIPYDVVRNGEWTCDAMYEIMTPCISLNGDETYTENTQNATFGVSTFNGWIGLMTTTADTIVQRDADGIPTWVGVSERLITACTTLEKLFANDGHLIPLANASDYTTRFMEERTAFCILSIGNASIFREMDSAYGILPIPKFAETDDYSSPIGSTLLMSIPVTCADTENVGTALDALTRYSYDNVLPAYYENLCYKGLRDEDSIDMLEIIQASRTCDIGWTYNWTTDLLYSIGTYIQNSSGNYASRFAANESKIKSSIQKTMDEIAQSWD